MTSVAYDDGTLWTDRQALEYLFKFIVQSRSLYSRATCGMEEEQFRNSIQELFQSIRFVLSLDRPTCETLIFTQVGRPNVDLLGIIPRKNGSDFDCASSSSAFNLLQLIVNSLLFLV